MKTLIAKLIACMKSLSVLKLRIIAGFLFALGGLLGYFSRREVFSYNQPLSRIFIPSKDPASVHYIWVWELLGLAVLLFITAAVILIASFRKTTA